MGVRPETIDSPDLPVGDTTSKLVGADQLFQEVANFFPTEEGGYVSVYEPIPYLPRPTVGGPPQNGNSDPDVPIYTTTHGIFHARLHQGQREILLAQVGREIWEFEGWRRAWRVLIGISGSAEVQADLPTPTADDFPCQFVATPTGIVIVPAGGRAHFYDGEVCLPLGYDHGPSAPIGMGPESSASSFWPNGAEVHPLTGVNDSGYAMDSLDGHLPSYMNLFWRQGRVGTVDTPTDTASLAADTTGKAQVMGYLRPGRYRGRTQWVDRWGNLSPASGPSNDIRFRKQPAMTGDTATPTWVHVDKVLKQVAWASIARGPRGTIGRIVGRTKDMENSGDIRYYELPTDAIAIEGKYATLADNVCDTIPDNIPDAWLANVMTEVDPIPRFRLAAMAFGRLWMAAGGELWWSMVGKFGTIAAGSRLTPDPTGAEITGVHAVKRGLLVFTETSSFLIEANADGDGFRTMPLSERMGCVAPSSIVTHRTGVTVWLGQDGFYGFDGNDVGFLFALHRQSAKRHNRARMRKAVACFDHHSGEYRCWVPTGSNLRNNRCWTWDGEVWHHRNDVSASGATTTQDHRRLVLVSGTVNNIDGIWVCDRGGPTIESTLKSGWLRGTRSRERASTRRLRIRLRETGLAANEAAKLQVRVRRDYRAEVVSTQTLQTYPEIADGYGTNPDAWGTATVGSATWRKRRPFEAVADIMVSDCETFQIELAGPARFEILSVGFEEAPHTAAGAKGYR